MKILVFNSCIIKVLIFILGICNLSAQIILPVEVLGENLTVSSRTFNIPDRSQAKNLYLLVNNFSTEGKVELNINDSRWISLNNSNTSSDIQGEAFGGIGGGYSTLKVYVNISRKLKDGVNTIKFRYNNINDNISLGYRIVDFNILKDDGSYILPASYFQHEDPSTWKPIYTDSLSISEGKKLWYNALIIDSSKRPIRIKAKCASCHAEDGRDLKYFNYSNHSIVERSKFHGLTQLEGEKIASYIRSLDVNVPKGARPWNPPYQPGPGLDAKPVFEWSAGAGLEWVLDSDAEMLKYMFPKGTSDAALNNIFDIKGTLNIREIPIAIQFPDWNSWLPQKHPIDMLTPIAYNKLLTGIGGVSKSRQAGAYGYKVVKQKLKDRGVDQYNNGSGKSLVRLLGEIGKGVQDFLFKNYETHSGFFSWTITMSPGIRERPLGMTVEYFKMNLSKWNAVKHWEVMQEFKIEGVKPYGVDYAEARQWPVNNWTVFAIAPHIIADKRRLSKFSDQNQEVGYYQSTAWYQLQMTLNSGMRIPVSVAPVDWAYNFAHITKSGIYTGYKEPLRLIQNFIKAYQQRDNLIKNDRNDLVNTSAWNMREVSPWRLYSTAQGDTSIHDELDMYETGLRAKMSSKLLKMFMDKADLLGKEPWLRSENSGLWHGIEKEDFKPINNSTGRCKFPNGRGNESCSDIQSAVEANAIFTVIPEFQKIGVDCVEVQRLNSWAEAMWPKGAWSKFKDDDCIAHKD